MNGAQDSSPPFFEQIVGEWQGEGELFGRPARFEMRWEWELDRKFVRLTYAIRGDVQMDAIAHYRLGDANPLDGVWLDSRGEVLELSATLTNAVLDTQWRSPTERGRTSYQLFGTDSLVVRDSYHDGTDWKPFGQARYARVGAGKAVPGR